MLIAIPFVPRSEGDGSASEPTSSGPANDIYYRAMIVCFASLRRWNADADLVLVSNVSAPLDHAASLEGLGVRTQLFEFAHEPPADFLTHRFAPSLFFLDALQLAAKNDVLFLDPDVVCVRELDRFLEVASEGRVAGLPIDYKPDHPVNGLTRREARALHLALGEADILPPHFGGECYWIPSSSYREVAERCETAWRFSIAQYESGAMRFTTEEHLMSFAFRATPVADLSGEIARIWTASSFRNVDGTEGDLSLWHLPAEKGRGFDALFGPALDRTSWFWCVGNADYIERVGEAMGLSGRSPRRFLRDVVGSLVRRRPKRRRPWRRPATLAVRTSQAIREPRADRADHR